MYEKHSDLILSGAYRKADDPHMDLAISKLDAVHALLRQGVHEKTSSEQTIRSLLSVLV
jgi:flagellar biosynthesis/type III secretory pathway ATPase